MTLKIKRYLQCRYPEEASLFSKITTIPRIRRHELAIPEAIVRVIAGQMLSGKAASTIYSRIHKASTAKGLAGSWLLDKRTLRACGLSFKKCEFVRELARTVGQRSSALDHWYDLPQDELIREISKLHGLGQWSAGILALFYIGKEDIFPEGDGSLRRATEILNLRRVQAGTNALFSPEHASPYRSYLALYLWRGLDTGVLKS